MANILEFLRNVLTDHEAQRSFRGDPAGYLRGSGFADLTGEDVVEGVAVLRGSLPESVAYGLHPFASRAGLPEVGPGGGESELDAAARVLGFAVDRVPTPDPPVIEAPPVAEPTPAPWPEPLAPEPVAAEPVAAEPVGAEPAAEPVADPWAAPAPAEAEEVADEGAATEAPGGVPSVLGPVTFDLGSLPSVLAFSDALDTAVAEARQRHDDALRQFSHDAALHARQVADRLGEVLPRLHGELEQLRAAAEASVAQLRAEAAADREAVRTTRESSQAEATALVEQARREADEILAAARAEADTSRGEIASRRAEMREAEEQLRERLSGIDSLFRRVLSDDGDPSGPS